MENKKLENIPNLLYKDKKGNIIEPKLILTFPLSMYPTIDYNLFDLKSHFRISNKAGLGNAVTIYSGKGCVRRVRFKIKEKCPYKEYNKRVKYMPACVFCGRKDIGLRFFKDERVKNLINYLYHNKKVRYFWEIINSYVIRDGPKMNIKDETYRFFIRLEDITKAKLDIMNKRFGKNLIFQVGVESGSQKTFDAMSKETNLTVKEIFNKLVLLKKYNIKLDPSFVLGVKGETHKTLEDTKRFIQRISNLGNLRWILISPLCLLPNAPAFNELLKDEEMNREYGSEDNLDSVEMNKDYLKKFTSVTREEILDKIKEIFETLPDNVLVDSKGLTAKELKYVKGKRFKK